MNVVATLVGRDRALIGGGVLALAAAAWLYLGHLSRVMGSHEAALGSMPGMGPTLVPWTATDVAFTILMWAVMMVGMMLPAAAPVILLFAAVNRRRARGVPTAVFVLGYLLVWGAFSVGAAGLQWGLHEAALLSPVMRTTSPLLGGALLIAAGIYQLTPFKDACLAQCRSPLGFLMTEWRNGIAGALRMGMRHGGYCLGCCAVLMGLLFVTGVMNLLWVAAIAVFVLLEKVAPGGVLIGRVASVALIGAGLVLLGAR